MTNKQLETKKARAEIVEVFLATKFDCFDENTAEYVELHHLLAEAWSQKEKDLTKAWASFSKAKARVNRAEKLLRKAKEKVIKVEARA